MKFSIALVAVLALVAASQSRETGLRSFNGYQVFTVEVTTHGQLELLRSLYLGGDYDFWTTPRGLGFTDVMAAPQQVAAFTSIMDKAGIKFTVKVPDVETLVREERVANQKAGSERISWDRYPRFAEIETWLNGLSSQYATVSVIGRSYNGLAIHAVKFSTGGAPKKSVIIDANIHAREWIAGATATWIINELITNTAAYMNVLNEIDIHVIPMVNPDGYEFCHTGDRLWRKTRSVTSGSACLGCDPNRNFAFMFGGESTSPNPCSDIYHGSAAFSESETTAVRDYIVAQEAAGARFLAYLTFHCYGNVWLLPWGYTAGVYPPDYDQQLSLGRAAIAALQAVHNTRYQTGQGADLLYGVGGASDDWAKNHGIKYTTTVEMRGNSFVLPPAQIIPNAQEVWAAVQVYFQRVIETP
ncbi:carboxypeptidase B [Folsomia candida]|uniref:carboxypeptidase B n=1 Tax=Folsomia candida TaxID=158441 RepID=UPI000B905ABC|nr:carboxypeptidase B [Folsomia candida]